MFDLLLLFWSILRHCCVCRQDISLVRSCFRKSYSLLKMQVCWRVYWLLVTFHILTVPSVPLVANRPFLLLQPHVMT